VILKSDSYNLKPIPDPPFSLALLPLHAHSGLSVADQLLTVKPTGHKQQLISVFQYNILILCLYKTSIVNGSIFRNRNIIVVMGIWFLGWFTPLLLHHPKSSFPSREYSDHSEESSLNPHHQT